ncbi:uncharacterized protein LOC111599451 isoform X2 [Drosophila hydei]|uniref:Uncharacterized protein LOC111599451 isoform X2 n=1 Tax=Drosophila hydei TaxID=7224 RepID=A0A6J1LSP5_DROHY|nr:uncharacterized protein LOC111599451 isoform X2 [Drosophila hydei]
METRKSAKAQTKRKSRRSGHGSVRSVVPSHLETKPIVQRVYLYMQLKQILHMPVVSYPLELHLYHVKNTLQKMCDHYTKETIIYQNEFTLDRPAFAMGIMQDNVDDMNTFSDNPLIVTLYQRIPRHRKEDLITVGVVRGDASERDLEEGGGDARTGAALDEDVSEDVSGGDQYVEETLEFVSRGHCDLLQLFQSKRFINNIQIMLYPQYISKLQTRTAQKITTVSNWHMYSILPILKNNHFSNLVFITFESLYNASEDLHSRAAHLGMSISMRATAVDGDEPDGQPEVLPLCTFYSFVVQVINDQKAVVVWESIKRDLLNLGPFGVSTVQMETNLHVPVLRIFQGLLKTHDVDFKLENINPVEDSALINNSMHRYVLTAEMQDIIEAAIVNNEYEILLQLYDEVPNNVLYEGVINPSIFGYPHMNTCRFASVLTPVARHSTETTPHTTAVPAPDLPMFAIVKLCFFHTLTKHHEPLDTYNESNMKAGQLQRCFTVNPHVEKSNSDILKELYRRFDELVKDVISYIIKHDVTSIDDRRNYFCCTINNLNNLLINICGYDFNVSMPTKNNIEFREMLTHMYKDLMDRIIRILNDCGWEALGNCVLNKERDQQRLRRLLDEHRSLCMVGECGLADQLFAELKSACSSKILLNFYVFLNSVQNLNFDYAKTYLLTQVENNWDGEYFVNLLQLYIDYQVELKAETEEKERREQEMKMAAKMLPAKMLQAKMLPNVNMDMKPPQAFSNMIAKLRNFATANNLDCEAWILLYCYYQEKGYLSGMEYTRWKYENLYHVPSRKMLLTPTPLFEAFLPANFDLTDRSAHVVKFYGVFKTFARLGAYAFAETVYNQIAKDFTVNETYLVTTTLKMLQGQIDGNFKVRNLPTNRSESGKMILTSMATWSTRVTATLRPSNALRSCFISKRPTRLHYLCSI